MMHGLWDGASAPWYGMFLGPIVMISFIMIAVVMIIWVLRTLGLGGRPGRQEEPTPIDTLKHHFARGEFDRAEYEQRKKVLLG